MLADLSQPNIVMIAGAVVLFVLILMLLWIMLRARRRWLAALVLGVLVVAVGAGLFAYHNGYMSNEIKVWSQIGDGAPERFEDRLAGGQADRMSKDKATPPAEPARAPQVNRDVKKSASASERSRSIASTPPDPASGEIADAVGVAGDEDSQEKWHVVPVFYGTDRNREETDNRIVYGAERGKRLEVGRALVTVPKNHKVANIERPWVYRIPLTKVVIYKEEEDPAKHFTISELKKLTEEEFIELTRARISLSKTFQDQALVFVHGFNMTFDYAVYRAAQLSYDLDFDGGSFVYSWPSRGQLNPIAYNADRESAGQATGYLEDFLNLIAQKSGAKSITLIAHSMGNELLLPVLQKFKLRNDAGIKISQIIFAAPDVDRDRFAVLAREFKGLTQGRVTLYAAANDLALDVSRQFWGGVARAGDVPDNGPIVVDGVDTIDVTETSTEIFFSLNHARYAQSPVLLRDIRSLMIDGYRLPHKRNKKLLQLTTGAGGYWKYE